MVKMERLSARRVWFQFQALLSCMFSMMSVGNIIGWLSPAIGKLKQEHGSFVVTESDRMWMSSLVFAGIFVGPIIFAFIVDRIGRKWIVFFSATVHILGWSITLIASYVEHLLISRFVLGLGFGFTFCIVPVYVGEITENRSRGAFTTANISMVLVGYLYMLVSSMFMSLTMLSLLSLVFPLASLLTFFLMPESPHYHIMKNNIREAEANLMRLRGETQRINVIEELSNMIEFLEDGFSKESTKKKFKLLQLRKSAFSLLILTVLVFTQCFSGVLMILSDMDSIIGDAASITIPENMGIIIVASVGLAVSLITIIGIDKIGRKPLFCVSSIGCCLSTAFIGTYYYLYQNDLIDENYAWVAYIGLFGFQIFFFGGLGSIPYTVGSEIFPPFIRPWTTAFMVIEFGLFNFIVSKVYHSIGVAAGYYTSFWIFSGAQIAGTIFIYIYMPETKKKSFMQIQEEYQCNVESPKPSDCSTSDKPEKRVNIERF